MNPRVQAFLDNSAPNLLVCNTFSSNALPEVPKIQLFKYFVLRYIYYFLNVNLCRLKWAVQTSELDRRSLDQECIPRPRTNQLENRTGATVSI
jgi:hypothetical protein